MPRDCEIQQARCGAIPGIQPRCWNAFPPRLSRCWPRRPPIRCRCRPKWRKIGVGKRLRDAGRMLELYQSLGQLGDDLPEAIELVVGAARPILERWFEAEVLRATLATDAVIGAFASPSLSRHGVCAAASRDGRSRRPARRVGLCARRHGSAGDGAGRARASIWASKSAASRPSSGSSSSAGQCVGVVLWDDTLLEAPVVASSIDAHQTFERLLDPAELPPQFRAAVAKIDYASASAKINLALSEPPQFTCLPASGHRAAPSRHDSHRPDARLHRAGLRRRQIRLAQHRADPGNHAAQRASIPRSPRRASTS